MDNKLRLLEYAWGIIANASWGNWEKEPEEWRQAAARWRDEYFKLLKKEKGGYKWTGINL